MSSQKAFQSALSSASAFLQPILKPQGATSRQPASVIENLYQTIPKDVGTVTDSTSSLSYREKSSRVIKCALDILSKCNQSAAPKTLPDALYAPREQRIILCLADLILLEGIYPNVTPGILPPLERRTKSSGYFSQVQAATAASSGRDVELLGTIVDNLEPILATSSNEVSDAVRERLWMDFIACLGELAFHPETGTTVWQKQFAETLDSIPVPILLPLMVPLIQSATPPWFQKELTGYLSIVPLKRTGGVKDEIMFFIDSTKDVSTQRAALQQASRLIGSVPSSSTPGEYFSIIAPQLLELLDDAGQIGTASAIVINDLFERRKLGLEKFFFPPLLQPLRPLISQLPPQDDIEPGDIVTVSPEDELKRALHRVSLLFRSSAGSRYLASHILSSLVLPLWGLWQFSASIQTKDPVYTKLPSQLLTALVKLKTGELTLGDIIQHFNYDGDDHWTFRRGEMGGVKIIMRDPSIASASLDLSTVEAKVPAFIELALAANDDTFTKFFLNLCRKWLQGATNAPSQHSLQDAFKLLFQLKVLEGILEHHSERLTRQPEEVIMLIKEILDDYVRRLEKERERVDSLQRPSMGNLGDIIGSQDVPEDEDDAAGGEAVGIALQLLNSIISTSFSRTVSEQEKKLLTTLQPSLTYLAERPSVEPSMASLTRSLSLFISSQDIPLNPELADEPSPLDEKALKQQQTLQTALLYLRDEMVPIRAHGLELLKSLIAERASVIDVPAITKLLTDMLQDKESFVYLGVVKTLCELSDKHPATVIRMLVEVYVDEKENMGIDERLKTGEALMGTVQRLGETAVGKVAEEIGNVLVGLAGRRKRRYREAKEVKREKGEEDKRIKTIGEMDKEYAKVLKEARVEAGIDDESAMKEGEQENDEQWISKAGEEDYRIRTSALSILGVLYETNASGVPSTVTLAAVDVALSILNLERSKEQATIRRAAAHLISGILNGLEKNGTAELLKVIPKQRLEDIVRVFGYVRATDDDGLVREQAGSLLEILAE
ncbi:hypothetical protein Dda_2389 [Drechslerella dactyloides]|uniref:RNA polymerase II assembly factor Rtp1 C-terminal domain-containing protein n=1 Tax=Drechslerella dactyloides TaxID=74499 RepID=A0AAD6J7F5_DREDA|nr:hypothetical protein Dda_2389 [Drechslerella dactyloides]